MRSKPRRSVLGWSLIGLACLLGLICLWMMVGPIVRSWQVEKAIAHFERGPSQARADELVGLLQSHAATTEQGSRILTLLRRPTITTRPTYPAGRPVMVTLEQPFHLVFGDAFWRREELRMVEGGDRRSTTGGGEEIPRILYLRGLSSDQAEPGIHQRTVRGAYSLALQRRGGLTEAGHWAGKLLRKIGLSLGKGWLPDRQYECKFEMPFEVTVVPKDQAEIIKLVSSPQLDDAMANAFQVGSSRLFGSHRTASGQVLSHTSKVIHYHDLPISAAFRLTLHLSDRWGRAVSLEDPKPLVAKAGASGQRSLSYWLTEPGTYTGTIVLHPDPNRAYEDPAIEAIWNGTLEFPISFTISE